MLSAVIWGQKKIREQKRSNAELRSMCRLVGFVGNEIEHFSKPLTDIFSEYSDEILEKNGFLSCVRQRGFEVAVREYNILSDGREKETLCRLAKELGGISRTEQTELCAFTEKELSSFLAEREKTAPDKEKLYRTCPLLLALAVILMFI